MKLITQRILREIIVLLRHFAEMSFGLNQSFLLLCSPSYFPPDSFPDDLNASIDRSKQLTALSNWPVLRHMCGRNQIVSTLSGWGGGEGCGVQNTKVREFNFFCNIPYKKQHFSLFTEHYQPSLTPNYIFCQTGTCYASDLRYIHRHTPAYHDGDISGYQWISLPAFTRWKYISLV